MKNKILHLILLLVILLLRPGTEGITLAQQKPGEASGDRDVRTIITPLIGYQGRLVINGVLADGEFSMTFRLFTTETGGTAEWEETKIVYISDGLFQTALGDTSPLDASHSSLANNLWLEIAVGGTTLPRQRLLGAPYALTLAPGAVILNDSVSPTMNIDNLGTGSALHTTTQSGFSLWGTSASNAGVYGESGTGFGVCAESSGVGLAGSALKAEALNETGVAAWVKADSLDATLVTSNDGTGALVKGFGGDSGEHEFIIENDGSFKQELGANGLVKAAVYAFCGSSGSTVVRYFNNVVLQENPITILNGGTGMCSINFGFPVNERYFMVTAPAVTGFDQMVFASCLLSDITPNTLICARSDHAGTFFNGYLMILVY